MSSNIKNSLVFFIIGSSNPLKLEEEAEDLNGDEEEGDEEALFELELELEP